MPKTVAPHLDSGGNAGEALAFYAAAFDTQPAIRTYGDVGMPAGLPDTDKVVWGQIVSTDGVRVMAYDVPTQHSDTATHHTATHHTATRAATQPGSTLRGNSMTFTYQPYFLALSSSTLDEATAVWDRLAVGATVVQPLGASGWSARFGMLTDRFGVTWVVDVSQ